MKLNWGIFAFGLFGSFALFMIGLAIFASQQTNELVTDDYYEKELEFKEVIKKQERTQLLSEQLSLEINKSQLVISFPQEINTEITGTIVFFKPSSEKDDKEVSFQTSTNNYKVNIRNYSSGMYKVKIDWDANNTEYYNEDQIVIP